MTLRDLSDQELRDRAGAKWTAAGPDVLPAWVAEMDFALAEPVAAALHDAVDRGAVGYSPADARTGVAQALAAFTAERWAWTLEPAHVVLVPDVMAGIELVLRTLCEDAAVVVPTPAYPPFLDVVPLTGRALVPVPLDPDGPAALDLHRIDAALAAGARTVLLCQPHNPWGRVFDREELEGLRDVVLRHGARVVSDEVHAPLVLAGAAHLPYGTLEGTAAHTTTVLSAAKAWNVPGLRCAQVVTGTLDDAHALRAFRTPPTTAPHRSAWSAPSPRTGMAPRGCRSCCSGSTPTAPSSAASSRSCCPACGSGRWRRRTSPGWTSAHSGTRTRRAWRCARAVCWSTTAHASALVGRATSGSTWPPPPSGWSASSGSSPRPGGRGRSDESAARRSRHRGGTPTHREALPMRTLTVIEFLSLDGVMQAPGSPEEDTDGGFRHGGWQRPYFDEVLGASAAKGMASTGAYLFGRRTYEIMARHWPTAPADDPFTAHLNSTAKYVASTTLREVGGGTRPSSRATSRRRWPGSRSSPAGASPSSAAAPSSRP